MVFFLVAVPFILAYSIGYRIDFERGKIVSTGGIYVRTNPSSEVTLNIDGTIQKKTGILSNDIFVQNLLPKVHNIVIQKDGYHDYQKNLEIRENEVTKLEHIILFKKDTLFEKIENSVSYFSVAPNNTTLLLAKNVSGIISFEIVNTESRQIERIFPSPIPGKVFWVQWSEDSKHALVKIENSYFLADVSLVEIQMKKVSLPSNATKVTLHPQGDEVFYLRNGKLYSTQKPLPITEGIITYLVKDNFITWLSSNGFLYRAKTENLEPAKLSEVPFSIKAKSVYELVPSSVTLLKENTSLFFFDQKSGKFESVYDDVADVVISPDNQKMLYCNNHEVIFSYLPYDPKQESVFLNRFSEHVSSCAWIDDHYVIFTVGNKITISEIDERDHVNAIDLPQSAVIEEGRELPIQIPEIWFNQQDKKLYLLTQNYLLATERLIP